MFKALKALLVFKEHKVLLEHRVPRVLQVLKVLLALKAK